MRINSFVLTAAIALFGCVAALPTRPTSTTPDQDALEPERFLQGGAAVTEFDTSLITLAEVIPEKILKAVNKKIASLEFPENLQELEEHANSVEGYVRVVAKEKFKKELLSAEWNMLTAEVYLAKFDEHDLIDKLVTESRKEVAKARYIAKRLLDGRISSWVAVVRKENRIDTHYEDSRYEGVVFDKLVPYETIEKFYTKKFKELLNDPLFDVWVTFMRRAHGWNTNREMAAFLAERFGEEGLTEMLVAAKKDPEKKEKATMLENGQTRYWQVRYSGVGGAVDLFKKLYSPKTLQEPGYGMFVTPQFKSWAKLATDQGLTVEEIAEIMEKKFSNEFFLDYLSEATKRKDDSDKYASRILEHLTAPYNKFLTPEFKGRLKFTKEERASVQQMAEDMEAEFVGKDLIGYLHYGAKLEGNQPAYLSKILEYLTAPYNMFVLPEFQQWAAPMMEKRLSVRQVAEHWVAEQLPADIAKTDVINYLSYAAGRKDDQHGFAREILKYLTKPEEDSEGNQSHN